MKYKYTRKEIVNKWETTIKYSGNDLIRDLLAQKEDKKECICNPFTKTITCPIHGIKSKSIPSPEKECIHEGDKTDWHPQFCRKCGAEFMYDFSTPSPLEIEEIETPKVFSETRTTNGLITEFGFTDEFINWVEKVTYTLNSLTKRINYETHTR